MGGVIGRRIIDGGVLGVAAALAILAVGTGTARPADPPPLEATPPWLVLPAETA